MKIKLKITTSENMKLLGCEKNAIHEIELEEYIAAVVASEVGNAPLEACKAQAVAARSYAIAHGVLKGKVISDSSSTAQACRLNRLNYTIARQGTYDTESQVLQYNGEIISSVYTASNGGRTVSSEEKWGGIRPYLIAQDDLWDAAAGKKKSGHGVGMSQAGAIFAAGEGFTYKQILKFYYPGTKVVKLDMENDKEIQYDRKVLEDIKTRIEVAMATIKKGL